MKKIVGIVCAIAVILCAFSGCTEAEKVSKNISKEADLFNVTRRIIVLNSRTDTVVFEMIGTFSIHTNDNTDELEVICQLKDGTFQKHYIYLNEYTMYVVEDISHTNVNKYRYELNILPESLIPFELTFDK